MTVTLSPDAVYIRGLDFFSAVVGRLGRDDWAQPSPCARWRALDVLGHVGIAVQFGTSLLRGEQPGWSPVEPPGALVNGDPGHWWTELVEPARVAVADVDLSQVVDSPMGRRSIGDGLSFPAVDLFIHGWDLARSNGQHVEIPADVMEFAHWVIDALPETAVRSERVFAAQRPVLREASPSRAFLAWAGRDPDWSPPSNVVF